MPTRFLACYFHRELFWSLDASCFLVLSRFWSAWVWPTRTLSWMVWKDYYVGQFLGLSLSWTVLCLLWKDYYMDQFLLAARRRGVHVANVIPGPRPRQGLEVETSSIACCFGGTLLAQIKQQSSMSGIWYFQASALEMEKEEGWFVLRHKNQVRLYIFLCDSEVSILWVGLGLTKISQS